MDTAVSLVNAIALALAIFGGALSSIFVVWSGIQWMSSSGDPNRVAQARGGLIAVGVGIVLVGVAMLIPRVISDVIIEPAGGVPVATSPGVDCDRMLRDALVVNLQANNAGKMNRLVEAVQNRQDACGPEWWNPKVVSGVNGVTGCPDGSGSNAEIGGFKVSDGLKTAGAVSRNSTRADNNILVYFNKGGSSATPTPPSDGSHCWLYVDGIGWFSGP